MIHKSSVIDSKAKVGKDVKIGPFCFVGANVQLGDGVELISNVHIEGNTIIGKGTKIYPFASIGTAPQDLKYKGESNSLEIGENNVIREYVTINPGTAGGGSKTVVGNNCLFMISSHIAHDCIIENNVIFANQVTLGGHVYVESNAVIGGISAVHQFCRIGNLAMIGGMSAVENDVIPYSLAVGNRAKVTGVNIVGLRRANYSKEQIREYLSTIDKIFTGNSIDIEKNKFSNTKSPLIKNLISFLDKDSSRGLCKYDR